MHMMSGCTNVKLLYHNSATNACILVPQLRKLHQSTYIFVVLLIFCNSAKYYDLVVTMMLMLKTTNY
jgi:hypothetical protein